MIIAVRVAALTALAVSALCSPVAAQSTVWTYETRMDVDSGNGAARRNSMVMRYQLAEHRTRFEFVQATGLASAADGMYMVFDDRDSTILNVMPTQQMATIMGFSTVKAFAPSLQMNVAGHATQGPIEDLGAGERILGHATHRYRVTSKGTVAMTMNGVTCSQTYDSVQELWIAPDVEIDKYFDPMVKMFGTALGSENMPHADTAASKMPKGTALRTVSRAPGTNAQGEPVTIVSTMEIIDLKQSVMSDELFKAPSDYKLMDMRKLMASIPAGVADSIKSAGATVVPNPMCKPKP
jgi:hypothetical protein